MQVAETIRRQLGNKFAVMTGACNWLADKNSVSFKIGRNRTCTHVRVTLNSADLYDIEFIRARAGTSVVVHECVGVGAENLAAAIGRVTEMAVSL